MVLTLAARSSLSGRSNKYDVKLWIAWRPDRESAGTCAGCGFS